MNKYAWQCLVLAHANQWAPLLGYCWQMDGTMSCPAEPTLLELRWWWTVTWSLMALCLLHLFLYWSQPWPAGKDKNLAEVRMATPLGLL